MNILVAPDSFKDSLSASEVSRIISEAISAVIPSASIRQIPISDGGEGLLEALLKPLQGTLVSVSVKDPLHRTIEASYGLVDQGKTAIIEMATASGLELLSVEERNPLITSTYGTGELIKNALDKGCTKIIIGLGGSATNDGGIGMIKALGGLFLDQYNQEIADGGGALSTLHSIDLSGLDKRLQQVAIVCACDVDNPLTGPSGASYVYAKQKGASDNMLAVLDSNLSNYATVIKATLNKDLEHISGTGAAGGTALGLLAFLDATLTPGIALITELLHLEKHIKEAQLVVTGEGKIDIQTLHGKTIMGIASLAKKHSIPVLVFTGSIGHGISEIYDQGVTAIFSIVSEPMSLETAIKNAAELLQTSVTNVFTSLNTQI
ncbi:glycerate kinase [Flavobacteriaceae bacterium]|nr:glycerate kinase [Flavobacteriaceae bacterium]MDB2685039.1 glycerate kinase [Flavobacteriaceae bacterium]MDB4256551.1 glycerate kinase [Flavobacteriaceae bacterium]